MDAELDQLSRRVGTALERRGWMLGTAESCTGGWIAQVVTATAGSSNWFDRGFVTYSNAAKIDMLGVDQQTLATRGAVSEQTVAEMVRGALAHSTAHIVVAVSGIAGPGGGCVDKPVGMVCLGWGLRAGAVSTTTLHFGGDRESVRRQTVTAALEQVIRLSNAGDSIAASSVP